MDYQRDSTRTTTEIEFTVTGAPDSRGPSGPNVTIRPEKLKVKLDGGPDAPIGRIAIRGRTVRQRDGKLTDYRENSWLYYGWGDNVLPPPWILAILDEEGLRFPEGVRGE